MEPVSFDILPDLSVSGTALPAVLGLLMLAAVLAIAAAGSTGIGSMVPFQPPGTGWLGALASEPLSQGVFLVSLLVFTSAYAGLVALTRRLPVGAVIALLAAIYLIVFLGPVTVSTDVFSDIAYARMGVLHGLNPYVFSPFSIRQDPSYQYVGTDWLFTPTAYGPLYTLLSYPFGLVGVVGAVWGMKALTLLACVAMDVLVWRCARVRGVDPKLALLLVGANPFVVIYTLQSVQNDLIMLVPMLLGIYLTLTAGSRRTRRDRFTRAGSGAASLVASVLIKASAGVVLPYLLVSRRKASTAGTIVGVAVAATAGLAVSFAVFGVHGANLLAGAGRDAVHVSNSSFVTEFAHLLGKPGVYPADHRILEGLTAVILAYLLWRTWHGLDWIAAAGWALLALAVVATWLQPWYLIWPLPLAVLARDRRLLWATLTVQGLFLIHQLAPLFVPL